MTLGFGSFPAGFDQAAHAQTEVLILPELHSPGQRTARGPE